MSASGPKTSVSCVSSSSERNRLYPLEQIADYRKTFKKIIVSAHVCIAAVETACSLAHDIQSKLLDTAFLMFPYSDNCCCLSQQLVCLFTQGQLGFSPLRAANRCLSQQLLKKKNIYIYRLTSVNSFKVFLKKWEKCSGSHPDTPSIMTSEQCWAVWLWHRAILTSKVDWCSPVKYPWNLCFFIQGLLRQWCACYGCPDKALIYGSALFDSHLSLAKFGDLLFCMLEIS